MSSLRHHGRSLRQVLRVLLLGALVGAMLVACTAGWAGQGRYALVIGNNTYRSLPRLDNAVSDSELIAAELKRAGFEVRALSNADRRTFITEVIALSQRAEGGGEAAFFYAGHGIQIGATNYLLPVDFKVSDQSMVPYEAISLTEVSNHLLEAKTRFSLLVIDACRDNPLPKAGTRTIGAERGLVPISPATGQLVVYSAGNGQTALDGLGPSDPERHSVFVREFVKQMRRPGVSIKDAIEEVRDSVEKLALTVNHAQRPAVYDESKGRFYFYPALAKAGEAGSPAASPSSASGQGASTGRSSEQIEDELWSAIRDSPTKADFEYYLKEYPDGRYARLARLKALQLGRSDGVRSEPVAPAPARPAPGGVPVRPAPPADAAARPARDETRSKPADVALAAPGGAAAAATNRTDLAVRPDFKVGDYWEWQVTDNRSKAILERVKYTVRRVGNVVSLSTGDRPASSIEWNLDGMMIADADKGLTRSYRTPLLVWPLEVGKKWQVIYDWTIPLGGRGQTKQDAEVVAFEEVSTPAGKYNAYRIELKGYFYGIVISNRGFDSSRSSGYQREVIWFAPQVGQIVKHDLDDGRTKELREMTAFKRAER